MGIVRLLSSTGDVFRAHLWTKKALKIYHYLGKGGHLIINIDATGGLLDFPAVEHAKGKILHMIMAVSPKYALLADGRYLREKTVGRMLSPLKLAEMASNQNTADDYYQMYRALIADEKELFPNEETAKPLLVLTDCSPQLQSGSLHAYSSGDGMANT